MLYTNRDERETVIEKINDYIAKLISDEELTSLERMETAKLLKKLVVAIEDEQRRADEL